MNKPDRNHGETNNKEPWLAVSLSGILPGIGQIYAQKSITGYLILLTYLFLIIVGLWLLISVAGNALVSIVFMAVAFLIIPTWSLFDAYYSTRRGNTKEFESERKQSKDVWLAVFLSTFIPGLGHAYLRRWLPAILFFIAFIIVAIIGGLVKKTNNPLALFAGIILNLFLAAFAIYHVYVSGRTSGDQSRKKIKRFIAAFVSIPVVLSPILAFTMRQFVAEARYIPSGSMLPTLKVDDRLIINKLDYRFNNPEQGDIVVFSPTNTLQDKYRAQDAFIMRIIGLPGDRIQVTKGKVYINNQQLNENYVNQESLLDQPPVPDWGPQVVPPNSYMVLGDNRNNSLDSRSWGFVPRENIIGKATQRFWPFARAGSVISK